MPQLNEQTKKKAQKVVDNGGSLPLAHLDATIETNDKLDLLEKQTSENTGLMKEMLRSMKEKSIPVELIGMEQVVIQGEDGKDGVQGPQGEKGEKGDQGEHGVNGLNGKDGKDGLNGIDGIDGLDGEDGKPGKDGKNGKDGSPDTGADLFTKINSEKKLKIKAAQIDGLPNFTREVVREIGGHAGAMETPLKDATTRQLLPKDAQGAWLVSASGGGGSGTVTNVASADGSITVTNPTTTPDLTVVKSPKLSTARTIGTVTGDATSAGSSFDGSANNTNALTLATVNSNVGSFGSATQSSQVTVNGKGLVTAASNVTITPAASSITGGAALTKTDDTNITLTLGGSPSSALIAAASLTLGWTGTLAVSRGGIGVGTLTGIAKGNGTSAFTAAVAGTDYQAPITLTTTGSSGAATFISNTLNIPQYSGGGTTTTFIDQTPDNGTYGLLAGSVNGSNALFTISTGAYTSGKLQVYLNGFIQLQGASDDYVETTPASGTLTFNIAPPTGSIITAVYQSVGGSNYSRSINSISSPATAGSSATTDYWYFISGTTTLTLPTAIGNTNIYVVKNTGVATVTIATTSAQTIDGSSTASLPVANTSLTLMSDGSNWRVV